MTKKDAYVSNEMQLQNQSLTFFHKTNHFCQLPAFCVLSSSPMAYYVDFGKCQDRFWRFSWSKVNSNYLDIKRKVFKDDDNKEFRLVQNRTMGEAVFNQFMGLICSLCNQLVIAAENFAKEENMTPVLIPLMSKDMEEQLKLAHKVVAVMDRANRKTFGTLLRYNVDKPDSSCAQIRIFARKMEDEKLQQVIYVS